ncbi:MAG: hypothetical protein FWE06_04920 [Oscillospiraceae bacterium]|nr:hypothetical protein [Oscillospiraceae bacterium]
MKKFLVLSLALTLLIAITASMVGCGNNSDYPNNDSPNTGEFAGTFVSNLSGQRIYFHADGTWETDAPPLGRQTGTYTFANNRIETFFDEVTSIALIRSAVGFWAEPGSEEWYALVEEDMQELEEMMASPIAVYAYDSELGTLRFYGEPDDPQVLTRE